MSDRRLEALIRIAADASKLVQEIYATPFVVDYKGPSDPVTEADRRANALICERLEKEFPGVPIVAEESDPETFADFREASEIFFVDPVDGTNEFIERNPEFVVMIGLVEGNQATTAVLDAPAQGLAWAGTVGHGAFSIERSGARAPIRVTEVDSMSDVRLVSSRSHRTPKLERALGSLGVREIRPMGSAGLKGVAVARGLVDAHLAPFYAGKRWDACAAEAIVLAAGGQVSDAYGDPIDYRAASLANDRGILESNGRVHAGLLARIAQYRSEQTAS